MATRSRIGVMHGNVCKSVYCHWDGYLENNGRILLENYDQVKANKLISLGDISSLGPEIGTEHPFSQFESSISAEEYEAKFGNMTTFYGRDRGEKDVDYKVTDTFQDFLTLVDHCGAEYYYIIKDGVWYAGSVYETQGLVKESLVPLEEALELISEEEKV